MRFLLAAVASAVASADAPPCHTIFNPALETICSSTVTVEGKFALRDYAAGLNVSLITSAAPTAYNSWAEDSLVATEELLYYFVGENAGFKPVPRTVPIIYRPSVNQFGQAALSASMAIPTSIYPNAAYAPAPTGFGKAEAFPAQRFAAAVFVTATPATDLQYSFACGEAAQWLAGKGLAPVTTGPWAQAWVRSRPSRAARAPAATLTHPFRPRSSLPPSSRQVTYSGRDATQHVQECWLSVAA